ncbi:MAG: hypothetical protein QM724_10610 [Flavobacteriales bacterium]
MAVERLLFLAAALLALLPLRAQSILQRRVEVHAERVRLAEALALVAHDGHFKLSYNAALIPVDSLVSVAVTHTVERALRTLLPARVQWKESGEHIILQEAGGREERFTVRGSVFDAVSGSPLSRASIYELEASTAARSTPDGSFALDVAGQRPRTALLVAKSGYRDTVVFVGRDGAVGRVALRPREKLEHLEARCLTDRCAVDDLGVARLLVPAGQMETAENLVLVQRRRFQASLIPGVGTNKDISGAVVNNISFNLIGGYARGLEGLEVGAGFNMERRDVKGVQVAGLANLAGGDTKGVQVSGGLNHTMKRLDGVQIAGLGNTVWDTLVGVQVAGGANVIKGGMRGTQISGGCNVATQNVDGTQVSAGGNVCVRDVRKAQFAAGFNYGRNVSGVQFACGLNVAVGSVGGGQVGLGVNYARQVTGGQVSLGVNVVADTVRGGQVGTINFARVAEGGQVGLLNFSDTILGTSVGLLSVALHGYHRFDVSCTDVLPLTFLLRTGTRGFYNILSWSAPVEAGGRWAFGYGFGTEPRIGKKGFLNIELTGEQVVEQAEWVDAVNILGRFGIAYGHDLGRHLLISAGPLFNLLITDRRAADGAYLTRIPPQEPIYEEQSGTTRLSGWAGFRAGIGVRF